MAASDSGKRTRENEDIKDLPQEKDVQSGTMDLIIDRAEDEEIRRSISKDIALLAEKHGVLDYKIILLYDEGRGISEGDLHRVYAAVTSEQASNILLVLHSNGGRIEPAYLISKTCKRMATNKFVVAVPRKAK